MFKLTVTRFRDGNQASEVASKAQVLIDHIEAAAARQGFEIDPYDASGHGGELIREGKALGEYVIYQLDESLAA